jgi:hypothetical protein
VGGTLVNPKQFQNPKSETKKTNPKSDDRNPKQIQITKKENPKREKYPVLDLIDSDFEFVSDFDIRISDFS